MDMPLTQAELITQLNAWYTSRTSDPMAFRERAFVNTTGEILKANFKCATAKLNQIIFYILNNYDQRMTTEDQMMLTGLRQILKDYMSPSDLDSFANMVVNIGHDRLFRNMMDFIRYFQFEGFQDFFEQLRVFLTKAGKAKWTVAEFDQKLTIMMHESGFDFTCPPPSTMWAFHGEIAKSFKEKFSMMKHLAKAKGWLTGFLGKYTTSAPSTVIDEILQLYSTYTKKAVEEFTQVEMQMSTGNMDRLETFLSKFLTTSQIQYLKSIFVELKKFPGTNDGGSDMSMRSIGEIGSDPVIGF